MRKSGMNPADMLRVYQTIIRPVVEYASVVYHTLIPKYLSDQLEKVQRQAMKIVYGWGIDYKKLVQDGIIEELGERRKKAIVKFALKSEKGRFGKKWFKKREDINISVRNTSRRKYFERKCNTERFKNNPINNMTSVLNKYYIENI